MKIGLVWDKCPSHEAQKVADRITELRESSRLFTVIIPGGLTSILQLGDIVLNGPCKRYLRAKYADYEMEQIEIRRAAGIRGRLVIKITREQLMIWSEDFIEAFNYKERMGITDILLPCLSKVGQNCFDSNDESFLS